MARPLKRRNICSLPESNRFGPLQAGPEEREQVQMTVDEYETIRLIDLEGFNQEECAEQMGVARSTVQGIYLEARKKLAEVLVNGKQLYIEGGEYRLCEGSGTACGRACRRHRNGLCFAAEKTIRPDRTEYERRTPMKIAMPLDGNTLDANISTSFGRAAYFLIFDTASEEARYIDNPAMNATGGAGILPRKPWWMRARTLCSHPDWDKTRPMSCRMRTSGSCIRKKARQKKISRPARRKNSPCWKRSAKVSMDTETSGKRIAVLSGKGGTGKTFLTVNLAAVAGPSVYIDCDVEEPNGHLFFSPKR